MNRRNFLHQSAVGALASAGLARTTAAVEKSTSQHPKVRVGFVGTQHAHATGKLAAICELPDDFELVGVVETDDETRRARQAHPKYGGVKWLSEAELLNAPGLQAIVVETAVRDLVPTAQRCIDAGCHVHLEKPGCQSRAEFVRLFAAARQRNRQIQMGYMLRNNLAFDYCFRAVRKGHLGRVFEVTAAMSKLVDDKGRGEYASNGGGAMFELGCHLIDAIVAVLGPPQKVVPFNRETRSDGVLDNQLAVFEYPSATATIRTSIVEPFGSERRHFEVSGENGTIAIRPLEPPQLKLVLERPVGQLRAGRQVVQLPKSSGRYHDQLREFAAIVRGDAEPQWSAEHDLSVHLAVLQASGLPTDT